MDLSETILAAMIGALATVAAAVFQLIMAFKSSDKPDVRTKRGSKFKSLLSIAALMVASAVGGFLYSEFLKQRSAEQMQAMRDELREVKELAALAAGRSAPPVSPVPPSPAPVPAAPAELAATVSVGAAAAEPASKSEALIYVPTCQPDPASGATECPESEAQRVALCGIVPVRAQITQLELFAQPARASPDALQRPWDQHVATLEQDLGGARFTGKSFEYFPSGASTADGHGAGEHGADEHRAVCVNFMHWSSAHPHLARMVVRYDFAAPRALPAVAPADATVLTDQAVLVPQAASFIAPAAGESQ